MPTPSGFTAQVLAGSGMDIKDMQRNALGKRYDVKLALVITESDGAKQFFDGSLEWTGTPYPFAVAVEDAMVELQKKLVQMGKEIATGGEAVPPT